MIREKKNENNCEERRNWEEKSGVREWTKDDDNEISNMVDPYYELQKNSLGRGNLREG